MSWHPRRSSFDELIDSSEAEELLAAANAHFAVSREERDEDIAAWDPVAGDGMRGPVGAT